jgi:hypothetical protein
LGASPRIQEADSIVNGVIIRHFGKQLDVEVLAGTGAGEATEETERPPSCAVISAPIYPRS